MNENIIETIEGVETVETLSNSNSIGYVIAGAGLVAGLAAIGFGAAKYIKKRKAEQEVLAIETINDEETIDEIDE